MCRRVENETMCIWSKTGMLAFPLALRDNCTHFHIKFEHHLIHQQNAVPQRKHFRHLHGKWKPHRQSCSAQEVYYFHRLERSQIVIFLKTQVFPLPSGRYIPLQRPRNYWAKVHSSSHSPLQAPWVNQYRQLLWLLPKYLQRYMIYAK